MTGAGEVQMLGEGLSEGSAWNQYFRVGRAISLGHLSWGPEVGQLSVAPEGTYLCAPREMTQSSRSTMVLSIQWEESGRVGPRTDTALHAHALTK